MSERLESLFQTVIGGTESEKVAVRKTLAEWFEDVNDESIRPYEVQKTPEDEVLIQSVEQAVDTMIKDYGGNPITLPSSKIHLVSPNSVYKITNGELRVGYHSLLGQSVVLEKGPSRIGFATKLGHELFHLKSYKSAQVDKDKTPKPYRSGIKIYDRIDKIEYLGDLEEAIVAKMEAKFYNGPLRDIPELKQKIKNMEVIKEWLKKLFQVQKIDEQTQTMLLDAIYSLPNSGKLSKFLLSNEDEAYKLGYLARTFGDAVKKDLVETASRHEEQQKLDKLMDRIIEGSNGKFHSREEVFDIFAKANFTGQILSLAKTVEECLGKGSFSIIAGVPNKKDLNKTRRT